MKGLSDLVPLAIGVAVIGGVTWFLLDRDMGIGRWVLAALLFAHGWVHLMFVFPQPETASASPGGLAYPFDMGRSWLIGGLHVDPGVIRALGVAVMVTVLALFVLATLATVGLLVPETWWPGLIIGSAAASTLLLAIFFSPALLLGFAINAALVWLVLASTWRPIAGTG